MPLRKLQGKLFSLFESKTIHLNTVSRDSFQDARERSASPDVIPVTPRENLAGYRLGIGLRYILVCIERTSVRE